MTRGGKVVRFRYDRSNQLSCRASAYYALSAEARRPSAALWHRRCGHLSDRAPEKRVTTPFELYNYRHSATRIVVEQAFGCLTGALSARRSCQAPSSCSPTSGFSVSKVAKDILTMSLLLVLMLRRPRRAWCPSSWTRLTLLVAK